MSQYRQVTFLEYCGWLVFVILALFIISSLSGCSTLPTPLSPSTVYRYDMQIEINGTAFDGVAVVKKAPSYHIKVTSKADMDLLTITSCSRETPVPSAIQHGWFSQKRGYEFDYAPNAIESQGGCPLMLGGYDKDKGRHSWSYVDFQGDEKIFAGVTCNGAAEYGANGVAICQSHTGLLQRLRFTSPVDMAVDHQTPNCRLPISQDGKVFDFATPDGLCTHAFMERAGKGEVFRFTTIGYDQVVIRSN